MTVRVNGLKGSGAGRYYTDHLPSYYIDGDEPPGRWWGKAAGRLGLSGDVQSEAFHALLDGIHPTNGAKLGRKMGEDSTRGYDATFSAPKSVSVLFGLGDEQVRDQVVEAHEAAVNAVLGWVEDHAHTRRTIHGHIMNVDTQGIVAATFRQHTSRRLDPQIHTHAVISNKVLADDGRWLALDARTIMKDQRTLSALYQAGIRAELTDRLGVRWNQPENGIAEIADIPKQVLAEFSRRSVDIERRLDVKLDRFRTDLGREPTDEERWRLEREAAVDSRPTKPHGVTVEQLREDWRQRTLDLGLDPDRVVASALGRQQTLQRGDWNQVTGMIHEAMTALEDGQSSWRAAELLRELAATTPTNLADNAEHLTARLENLAGLVVETRCVELGQPAASGTPLRRDGRPITEAATDRRLSTQAILDQERDLLAWAERRTQEPAWTPRRLVKTEGLDPGQIEVAAAVAGNRGLELAVGPAGAGKTTALNAGVRNLSRQGRLAFGVAPTAAAAEVLSEEAGMRADTLDKLLTEHNLTTRPPAPEYDLPPETTIILDEAATASTPKLDALASLADRKDWRVVMVGDPHQFSAVGRGGMFAHLVDIHGATELEQVHRFNHEWERQASLQLRQGDPRAIDAYEANGRLHGGTSLEMESRIVGAWWAAKQRGEEVVLMAHRNETVNRLNQHAQLLRKRAGQLDPRKGRTRAGDETLHVGDEVVTRQNDRSLRTDQGHMVKNRDHWTVTAIHRDRSVTITGTTGTIRLPADYVAEHVRLGYAQTSHSAQGRTVDTALLLVDGPTDQAGIYTPMTRGREANHAYVITEDNQTPTDILAQAVSRQWIDQPAITEQERLNAEQRRVEHRGREVDRERRAKLAAWERDPYSTTTPRPPDRGLSL